MRSRLMASIAALALTSLGAAGAFGADAPPVRLAPTSTLAEVPLLAYLLPKFTADTGVQVTVLPVYIGLCGVNLLQVRTTRRAFRWLLAAAVSGLTLLPWTVRNRVELGDWFLVRSNLGIELRMAFGEGAGASTQDNLASGHYRNVHPNQSVAAATELRDEGEIAYNRRLSRQAAEWAAANEHRAGCHDFPYGRLLRIFALGETTHHEVAKARSPRRRTAQAAPAGANSPPRSPSSSVLFAEGRRALR